MIPKVLFFGVEDHAGICWSISRAMNTAAMAAGAETPVALSVTMEPHPFGYPYECVLNIEGPDRMAARNRARAFAETADIICTTGDGRYSILENAHHVLGRRFTTWPRQQRVGFHVGSAFRNSYTAYNRTDESLFGLRIVGCDLLHLAGSASPTVPFIPPVDVTPGNQTWPLGIPAAGELVAGHLPSNTESKNSALICDTIFACGAPYRIVTQTPILAAGRWINRLPWNAARENKQTFHVYVDQMNPHIGGFGVSAIEAAHAGALVLADTRHVDPAHVPDPIISVSSRDDLTDVLHRIWHDPDYRDQRRADARRWCEGRGAFLAIGQRFNDLFAGLVAGQLPSTCDLL